MSEKSLLEDNKSTQLNSGPPQTWLEVPLTWLGGRQTWLGGPQIWLEGPQSSDLAGRTPSLVYKEQCKQGQQP